jgi:hypothetical protein
MTTKSLLLIGTLALASIASAKTYDLTLTAPANAGSVQMAAGEYSIKVLGGFAFFTNVDTGKKFLAPVKSEDAGKKFATTAVDTTSKDGEDQIKAIELGGSSTKLELGE